MTVTGEEIRAARERAGLTQGQLAQRLGVTQRTVGNWERGATVPKSRAAAIRAFLAPGNAYEPGLHSASDAELLAEIARRFARGREVRHDQAPVAEAGGTPAPATSDDVPHDDDDGPLAVVDVSGTTDRVDPP